MFQHFEIAKEWRSSSNTIALLSARDEHHLRELHQQAVEAGLRTVVFHDDDLTPSLTGLAIEPSPLAQRVCRGLPPMLKAA